MIQRVLWLVFFALAVSVAALGQNTNSSTTARPRTTNANSSAPASPAQSPARQPPSTPAPRSAQAPPAAPASQVPGSAALLAAFNSLLNGIRHADVKAVTGVYWNSPRLILFNNNGTVTRGWEQVRKNRESSYPDIKDVKLDVHDVSVIMLGRDGAVVSCLWSQSQTYKGEPETARGRMTLVFRRMGQDWKAVHLHTSPDKPEPSRVLPSEQAPTPTPTPTPN
ncbi:MAG TPA: nuclear transport factor 2 family protein [Pyrinomonadaceae bacterium]|nr:nuclear transport factor 2 family protein [Pyrinomonadaceae bacterium]